MHYTVRLLDRTGKLVATDQIDAAGDRIALNLAHKKYAFGLNVRCEVREGQRFISMVIGHRVHQD